MTRSATISSHSPQQPSDVVIEVDATSPADVEKAIAAARDAGAQWYRRPVAQRADALDAAAAAIAGASDELAALVVREVGKPAAEARAEVSRGIAILRYYAQQVYDPIGELHAPSATGLLFSQRRPHGVAGLITPWNFPVAIPLWKAAPALAFGNGVVLKPAPAATATALRLGELLADVLPPDTFRVLPGDSDTGSAIVAGADCVSFTGSTRVGRAVAQAAAARGIAAQAEMGGQNASIVLDDADPAVAAGHLINGAFSYAGQKCTATRRIVVVGDPAALIEALVERVRGLSVGDPAEDTTFVGPVISRAARDSVVTAAERAAGDGARILVGGTAAGDDDGRDGGWYVPPTLIDNLPFDHQLCREEVFGPICVVLTARDDADAVRIVNSVRYGLVTAVYTRDLDRALAVVDDVDTGLVKVNAPTAGVDFHLPFGGDKDSSYGPREQGKAARDFYTRTRTVAVAPAGG